MSHTLETQWIRRTKWLTQALMISGTLNIGLLSTFAYSVLKDKQQSLVLELPPQAQETSAAFTNAQLLKAYSLLPYQELLLRLENKDLIEEGLTKRDLSLSCLVAFHHFDIERALGGAHLQKRYLSLPPMELTVYPGLNDAQFQAILQFARTEKWPITSRGLFEELKRSQEPSLIEAFTLTAEFDAIHSLFAKTGAPLSPDALIALIREGDWSLLSTAFELSSDQRRALLLAYLPTSPKAAHLLLQSDLEYALKRLDDSQILQLLNNLRSKAAELASSSGNSYQKNLEETTVEHFAKELLSSPRTDAVWQKAAALLYAAIGEELPSPYDHLQVLNRFLPEALPAKLLAQTKEAIKQVQPKKLHTIEPGDSLWKLSRKYHVSIEEIMRVNHLETEKLRPGKQLEIP